MKWTGFLDKHDVKIFDADIVKINILLVDDSVTDIIGEVNWDNINGQWYIEDVQSNGIIHLIQI
jgi:ABC-type transporter MlaC component